MTRYRSKYEGPSRDSDGYAKCSSLSPKRAWCTLMAGHDGGWHEVRRGGKTIESWRAD